MALSTRSAAAASLVTLIIAVTVLLLAANPALGLRARSVYHEHCRAKMDDLEWRRVLIYEHNLEGSREGVRLLSALRKVVAAGGGVVPGADADASRTVLRLMLHPVVEEERQQLHKHSRQGFACVDELERLAAGPNHPGDRDWHVPAVDFSKDHEVREFQPDPDAWHDSDQHTTEIRARQWREGAKNLHPGDRWG
jgi:hypothetical protein